jgi:hypothetical protein
LSQEQLVAYVALAIASLAIIGLVVAIIVLVRRQQALASRYTMLLEGSVDENLAAVLLKHVGEIQRNSRETAEMRGILDDVSVRAGLAVSRIGLVRYNPFDDMGGDYSVALALTDSAGRGIVMSSLHGRAATRLYVRPLQAWNSTSPLSDEEQQAVRIAREGESVPTFVASR